MSPEQAEGLPVDKRTDIWSFGVVLWEMLTGRRLFDAPTVPRILADVLHLEIDFAELPPDIPTSLRTLIRRCLDRNMKTRLRDIGEARIALSHSGAPPSHEDNTKLPRFWVASTALLAVLLVALSLWHFRQKPGQSAAASAARTRFQFQAPMDGPINWLATSPDGRSVVMSTMIGSSAQKLWVRSFDDLQTRFLAQVEQAGAGISLMWSSDNQHIAVTAGGKLYRIPARGGTLTKIADIPKVILGSAWLEENTFLLGSQDGLLRVSLPQGRIKRLYDQRSVFPSPLQRGRFLFVRREGLYAGQLDGSPPVRLGSSAEFGAPAHFVPDSGSTTAGHLCFVRDRTLLAQRFDSGTLQFSGQPTPLADLNQVAASSVSETGVLVNGPASVARVLAWFDRSGRLIERVTRPFRTGPSNVVRLSPDGQKALTEILGLDGVRDLWVLDLARRTEFRLSFGGSASGVWSPDGKRILWGKTDGNRYIRNADGSGKDEWLFKETDCPACMIYQWAPDGNSVFAASLVSGPGDPSNPLLVITIVSTTGTQHKPALYSQPPPSRYWAQISPDGKWLAYIEGQPPMKQQIVVESIPAGSGRWQITTEGGEWPMWRSDGKELFYMQDGRMMAIPVKLTAKTVEFGSAKQLFEVLAPLGRYQVSRDGQRFLTEIPADEDPESRMITVDTDWRAGLPNQQK
jgi:Tol biopolymer transport system component